MILYKEADKHIMWEEECSRTDVCSKLMKSKQFGNTAITRSSALAMNIYISSKALFVHAASNMGQSTKHQADE